MNCDTSTHNMSLSQNYTEPYTESNFFLIFDRNFPHAFLTDFFSVFLRETSPGSCRPRWKRRLLRSQMILESSVLQLRFKTLVLTLQHCIVTCPVNHATFQATCPRVRILKLEECFVSLGASFKFDKFHFCLCCTSALQ